MVNRPLDLLHDLKGKKVIVSCKDNKIYSGKLLAFDIHINIVLEKCAILDEDLEESVKLGMSFFRGDIIKFIHPKK